jgi:hypothetical protein
MSRSTNRMGWARYGLLAVLVVAGGAGGLYLSGGWPGGPPSGSPVVPNEHGATPATQRFSLTARDARDTVEAPELAVDSAGRLFLTWASRTGESERTIFLTRTAGAAGLFDTPRAISSGGVYRSGSRTGGKTTGYERRASPHVAAVGDKVLLAWSEARKDGAGMRMLLAVSADAGATFSTPRPVHQGERANPTFTALATGPGGTTACAWLDDRSGGQQPFAAVQSADAGWFAEERLVHAGGDGKGVCPCCPTAACFAPDGTLYVAFRNIQDGYRDIAIGRLRPGQSAFEGPFPVLTGNTWKYDGCPHDGPSLAVAGDGLTVAWMDARTGSQRCYFAQAKLADLRFASRELHPGTPGNQGNPKLCADPSGGLHAVWEESLGAEPADPHAGHRHGASADPRAGAGGKAAAGRAIWYAHLAPGQADFAMARAVAPRPGAFQTRPAIVRLASGELVTAWNELDEKGKAIVVSRLAGDRAARGDRP